LLCTAATLNNLNVIDYRPCTNRMTLEWKKLSFHWNYTGYSSVSNVYYYSCLVTHNKPTNYLPPSSTVLLKKLVVTQLVEKIPTFYGNQRFIIVFTRACHCFLP
jgi:hypothetical protein